MSQIYGMESPINTSRPKTMWGLHISIIKWSLLTLAQLVRAVSVWWQSLAIVTMSGSTPHQEH